MIFNTNRNCLLKLNNFELFLVKRYQKLPKFMRDFLDLIKQYTM